MRAGGLVAMLVLTLINGCDGGGARPLDAHCSELPPGPAVHLGLSGGPVAATTFEPAMDGATYDVNCGSEGGFNLWAYIETENMAPVGLKVEFHVSQNGMDVGGGGLYVDIGSGQENKIPIYLGGDASNDYFATGCQGPPLGDLVVETVATDTCGNVATETHSITTDQKCVFGCR